MKYNKREIMMKAWQIKKTNNVTLSVALRASWALAKAVNEAEKIGKESGWNYKAAANDWNKYGKSRTYVSARIYTNAWNLKHEYKLGYIDNMPGEYIAA